MRSNIHYLNSKGCYIFHDYQRHILPVPVVRELGAAIGFTVGLVNDAAHEIRSLISKANSLVVGIYGAGGDTVGNAAFEKFIRTKGGELFTICC